MSYSVLVPLDESRWSRAAVDTALDLASRAREPVHLTGLHVVNVTHVQGRIIEDLAGLLGFEPVVVPERVEAHFRRVGQELLDAFEARCVAAGVPCRAVLEQGAVVDRVVHHGDRHDLVIMGVRGDTEERFPGQGGSTAERIVRRLATSALVVPDELRRVGRIALGFDDSDGAARALRAVAHLAGLADIPVEVVHVSDQRSPSPDPLLEARSLLEEAGVRAEVHRTDGEPREALPAEALRLGCDALALGYRGRIRLRDAFLGRTTEWLVGNVSLGLLVAR